MFDLALGFALGSALGLIIGAVYTLGRVEDGTLPVNEATSAKCRENCKKECKS